MIRDDLLAVRDEIDQMSDAELAALERRLAAALTEVRAARAERGTPSRPPGLG